MIETVSIPSEPSPALIDAMARAAFNRDNPDINWHDSSIVGEATAARYREIVKAAYSELLIARR